MDIKKQKAFNERMGKRQKYSKGGMIKRIGGRQYFDVGGPAVTTGTGSVQGTSGIGGIGNIPQPITSQLPSGVQNTINTGQGITGSLNPLTALQNATQNSFQAQGAPLQAGTNVGQINQAYDQSQNALGQQQNFVNQVQSQGGIGNQESVYGQQQNLANQLAQSNGIGNQQAAAAGFQGIANGTGPNVAQAQLNQSTAQNVANQGALMAGQRGASSNVGLLARQAAQQGAATQQQAAGQGATLQAQQQQSALSNLGQLGTSQVGQQQAQQANLGSLASTQVNQQGQAVSGLNTAAQNEQGQIQGANTAYNNSNVGMQSNLNNVNASTAQGNQAASNNLLGGVFNSGPSILSSLDKGGMVGQDGRKVKAVTHHYEDGGSVTTNFDDANYTAPPADSAPNIGSMNSVSEGDPFAPSKSSGGGGGAGGLMALAALSKGGAVSHEDSLRHFHNYFSGGGKVPAMVSPGEVYLSPEKVRGVIENGDNPLKSGHHIAGKAKVKGDSLKNDTIPATLEEGGVVIPRHIMKHRDPEKAELFVRRAVHMRSPK